MPVWESMHAREMDKYDFQGPPESNLALKTFVPLRLKVSLGV